MSRTAPPPPFAGVGTEPAELPYSVEDVVEKQKKKGRQTKRRQAKQCGRGAEPQTELPATPTFSHADALPVLPQVGSFTQTCVMKIIIAAVRSLFLPALPVVSGRPEFIAHFNPTGFQGGVPEGA